MKARRLITPPPDAENATETPILVDGDSTDATSNGTTSFINVTVLNSTADTVTNSTEKSHPKSKIKIF